jgi:hypothetical protein
VASIVGWVVGLPDCLPDSRSDMSKSIVNARPLRSADGAVNFQVARKLSPPLRLPQPTPTRKRHPSRSSLESTYRTHISTPSKTHAASLHFLPTLRGIGRTDQHEPGRERPSASLSTKKKQMLRPRRRIADATAAAVPRPHPRHQKPPAAQGQIVPPSGKPAEIARTSTHVLIPRQAGSPELSICRCAARHGRVTPYICRAGTGQAGRRATWIGRSHGFSPDRCSVPVCTN